VGVHLIRPLNQNSGAVVFRSPRRGDFALIRIRTSIFLLMRICTALARTSYGNYTERSPSEHINGLDRSALNINTLMNVANSVVRSPTRTCVRSVTLTRADVLALATSLNCILSCLVDTTRVSTRRSFPGSNSFPKPPYA